MKNLNPLLKNLSYYQKRIYSLNNLNYLDNYYLYLSKSIKDYLKNQSPKNELIICYLLEFIANTSINNQIELINKLGPKKIAKIKDKINFFGLYNFCYHMKNNNLFLELFF